MKHVLGVHSIVSRTWSCLVAQDVAGGEPLQVGGHQPFILQQHHFLYLLKNERNYRIKIYQTHMFCLFLNLCEEMVLEGYAFEKARTYFFHLFSTIWSNKFSGSDPDPVFLGLYILGRKKCGASP